ncbi:hypothetical protein BST61_g10977 [Cercospora zeina]
MSNQSYAIFLDEKLLVVRALVNVDAVSWSGTIDSFLNGLAGLHSNHPPNPSNAKTARKLAFIVAEGGLVGSGAKE